MMQCSKGHCISSPLYIKKLKMFNCGTQFTKYCIKNVLVNKFKLTIQSYKFLYKRNALLRFEYYYLKTIIECNKCLYKYSEAMEVLHNSCNTWTHVTTIHCSMHIQTILGGNFFMKSTISNFTGKNFSQSPKSRNCTDFIIRILHI